MGPVLSEARPARGERLQECYYRDGTMDGGEGGGAGEQGAAKIART